MAAGRVVFIAALEREVSGFVRGWTRVSAERGVSCWVSERAVVVCGGMGAGRAAMAVDAALRLGETRRLGEACKLISVGWAGACRAGMRVGEIVEADVVIDARTGERFFPQMRGEFGLRGPVVTVAAAAGRREKARLAASYNAAAVEMEAAAVARAARVRELPFGSIKAISDEVEFEMPEMGEFVGADGRVREAAFGLHVALRPRLWRPVMGMARGSRLAAERLWAAMSACVEDERVSER